MKKDADITIGKAEKAFRDAFERLKLDQPLILPKGSKITQNNIARESGCDPTALRKSRFPSLISEIQLWIKEFSVAPPPSNRQKLLMQREKNRSLRKTINDLKSQRDQAISLLLEADAKILELTLEKLRLESRLKDGKPNTTHPHN